MALDPRYRFYSLCDDELSDIHQVLDSEIQHSQIRFLNNTALWLLELRNSIGAKPFNCINEQLLFGDLYLDYQYSKALFLNHEYRRCSYYLRNKLNRNNIIDFIYYFCIYKAAIKAQRENGDAVNEINSQQYGIDELIDLKEDITDYLSNKDDCYIRYLYGMVLKRLDLKVVAQNTLIDCLNDSPFTWCAWYELIDIYDFNSELPHNWMFNFFLVKCLRHCHQNSSCDMTVNYMIKQGFDDFSDLKVELARVCEESNNLMYAREILEDVRLKEPYRTDYFGTLSNIYFTIDNHILLSDLVKKAVEIDKYTSVTCHVLGNYYGLRSEHEKSVQYFERALRINPINSPIWVLAAHEYTEMENYHAAFKCYSKAVEIDPNNHKALYALGQLYEMFKASKFALVCYERSFAKFPNDSRVLVAMGTVYEEINRLEEAKHCFYRAHAIGDVENIALFNLGKVYNKLKNQSLAATAFNLYVENIEKSGMSSMKHYGDACKYLAHYHFIRSQNSEMSWYFAMKCISIPNNKIDGEDIVRNLGLRGMRGSSANFDRGDARSEEFAFLESRELQNLCNILNDLDTSSDRLSLNNTYSIEDLINVTLDAFTMPLHRVSRHTPSVSLDQDLVDSDEDSDLDSQDGQG